MNKVQQQPTNLWPSSLQLHQQQGSNTALSAPVLEDGGKIEKMGCNFQSGGFFLLEDMHAIYMPKESILTLQSTECYEI